MATNRRPSFTPDASISSGSVIPASLFPGGASVSEEEQKKIVDALAALEKDPHAPRSVSITVTLNFHREFPKMLYKGKESITVQNAQEQDVATAGGFGPYDHEAFTAKETE